jgi:hypothetical protein
MAINELLIDTTFDHLSFCRTIPLKGRVNSDHTVEIVKEAVGGSRLEKSVKKICVSRNIALPMLYIP